MKGKIEIVVGAIALIGVAATSWSLWSGHKADHAAEEKAAAAASVTHQEAHKAQEGELGKLRDSINAFADGAAEKIRSHGEEK